MWRTGCGVRRGDAWPAHGGERAGAELILITPHRTFFPQDVEQHPAMLHEEDRRPYVANLIRFAEEHGLAVADASARWSHLAAEGIPFCTLLRNGLNHPEDRGHAIFAEELMKCFA